MKYAHDSTFKKELTLKLTETLNPSTFVSNFPNFIWLGVLHFLFTTQVYAQGAKWKKLLIHWNENQEKTTSISFQFQRLKLSRESYFTHFLNYGELCKESSTKQATAITSPVDTGRKRT